MKHVHIVTFRGILPLDTWNRLIKFLYDNHIPYRTINKISKTRDDAGLLRYFDTVIFYYDTYIEFRTNKEKISFEELIDRIKKDIGKKERVF